MREIISLNENWTLSFPKGDHATEQVNLPHTWNAVDGNDGNGSYLRTTGVYTRTFTAPKQPREGGRTYVEVLAAALNSTVKVNGQVATTHEGGFSIFRADVTDLCHDCLPSELLLSWTAEQMDYMHDTAYWANIVSQSRNCEVVEVCEMESNDEVWADWLRQENEYAVGDRKSMEAGAGKYLNFIKIVLRKKAD